MDVPGFIAQLWRTVFKQESQIPERTGMQPSPAWIREHVHVAIGEEALQSNSDEIYSQPSLPSAPFPSPPSASVEPIIGLPLSKPENGQTDMYRILEEQEHEDLASNLLIGWLSDAGIKRRYKPNEDSLLALEGLRFQGSQPQPFALFIVADGMGGHLYGQEASRLGIQTMIDRLLPTLSGNGELHVADFRHLLVEGVQMANQAIYQLSQERNTTMGSTLTATLVVDDTALVANVGDSRTYLYRAAEGLRQITKDHSLVAYLVEKGIIPGDAIYTHPQRNQVYRSLGTEAVIAVDTFTRSLQPGDTLLLCSDGLWEMVRDPLIEQVLRQATDPSQTTQALLQAALDGGGADNISAIVAQISQTTRCSGRASLHLHTRPDTVELPRIAQNTLKQSS